MGLEVPAGECSFWYVLGGVWDMSWAGDVEDDAAACVGGVLDECVLGG